MARLNLPLAFAELLAGAVVLDAAIKGASIADVVKGQAKQTQLNLGGAAGGPTTPNTGGRVFSSNATGSRLDQGQDLTSDFFGAPVTGTVVKADAHDPGWAGGGYLAIKADAGNLAAGIPSDVVYLAEGILPTVKVGDHVAQGQEVATGVTNPYNGVKGNIEWGPADPRNPGRPLAQAVTDAKAVVMAFYKWGRSIGAPVASSTASAGFP